MTAPPASQTIRDIGPAPAWIATGTEVVQAAPVRTSRVPGADRLAALLLLAAAVASGLAAFGLPSSSPKDGAPVLVAIGPPPSGYPGAFLSKPPFDPLRRPIARIDLLPVTASPQPLSPTETLSVAGVLAGTGEPRVLFQNGALWQGLGSEHLGWRVEQIGPDAVTLVRDGVSRLLRTRDALRP